jgi:hypothetical protein
MKGTKLFKNYFTADWLIREVDKNIFTTRQVKENRLLYRNINV